LGIVAVSHADVRRIADLARIAVADERLDDLARELNTILGHMNALAQVTDASAHQKAEQETPGIRLADDTGPSVQMERAPDAFAPATRDGFFLVPRLSTHDSTAEP
jgi:aspartyl-tRNA(Asn)/glutamyl-tRNA(Gln) amidotransferase subunit C